MLRKDHIIARVDLKRMKKNSMIIDVSCDRNGAVESCVPTTIETPTYIIDGILHYAVDHTPTLFYKTFSYDNSSLIWPYIDMLTKSEKNEILNMALIIERGHIIDNEIIKFQGDKNGNRGSNISL